VTDRALQMRRVSRRHDEQTLPPQPREENDCAALSDQAAPETPKDPGNGQ
jgi:hypothetical protein